MNAKKAYNNLNWLYNTLYGDMSTDDIKKLDFIAEHSELFSLYNKNSIAIIDAACGNGIQAAALALNGYNITATDISEEMINLTNSLAKKHAVKINTSIRAWDELPDVYGGCFDIVLCVGNSIAHSPNLFARERNLKALSLVLKDNGTLVIDSRNWEKIISENKQFTVHNKLTYRENDYIPLYHWK